MDIYKEILLDHYNNPRNYGHMKDATCSSQLDNISCGDSVNVQLRIKDNKIEKMMFEAEGCAVCIACTSILSEMIEGENLEFVKNLSLETFLNEVGLEFTPSRLKCASLGLEAAKQCIINK